LWAVYFMLDGFDLGLGALMPLVARNEDEKRMVYNTIGPFWNGNEVWLITAGGVTFAAFPTTYAVMFSGLYSALMLVLFALILRGVSIEFREKIDHPAWKTTWDTCLTIASFLPALLLGVAFANIFRGIPIDEAGIYHGTLFTLLNPYGLLGGLLFLFMFLTHGALWLAARTEGIMRERGISIARRLWIGLAITASSFLAASWYYTQLFENYLRNPFFFVLPIVIIPALTVAALFMMRIYIAAGHPWKAWFSSSVVIVGTTLFGVVGLYPNLLPSSLNPAYSLTVFNSSSSSLTLKIMLGVALFFVPLVIAYQIWVYLLFNDRIKGLEGRTADKRFAVDEAY